METDKPTLAVIGAGAMGLGIAQVAAMAGYETRLFDVSEGQLDLANKRIAANLAKGVARGKVEPAAAEAAEGRITATTDLAAALAGAGLMVEAVP
ncbi:3-hydroxybutyryl-CoA dehydrogenase, partial [bacterium]|nr:3-hydroxybutyryl-CoA dehydrogenase [bacterium]